MNLKAVKEPQKRINTNYLSSLNIQSYGEDNLYPNKLAEVVASSSIASGCLSRYADFIEGNGFNSQIISDYKINKSGDTLDDLLGLLANDLAKFGGFAIHANYDVLGKIRNIHHIPFITTRLKEPNDYGKVTEIAIHPNWTGDETRNGKRVQVNKSNISFIHVFDPNSAIPEIEEVGINEYKGQVLWYSRNGNMVYPLPVYDPVITDMSTDEGLANVRYRNARNNFLPSGALITRKGTDIQENYFDDERRYYGHESYESEYSPVLKNLQGDFNACKIVEIEIGADEQSPEFISLSTNNYDKEFTVTADSIIDNIYSAFNQEAFLAIRKGKLGFSGDILADAYSYYSGKVTKEQRAISRALLSIFKNWYEQPFGELTSDTFKIQSMLYGSTNNTN